MKAQPLDTQPNQGIIPIIAGGPLQRGPLFAFQGVAMNKATKKTGKGGKKC